MLYIYINIEENWIEDHTNPTETLEEFAKCIREVLG